jgi:hypothetical protein
LFGCSWWWPELQRLRWWVYYSPELAGSFRQRRRRIPHLTRLRPGILLFAGSRGAGGAGPFRRVTSKPHPSLTSGGSYFTVRRRRGAVWCFYGWVAGGLKSCSRCHCKPHHIRAEKLPAEVGVFWIGLSRIGNSHRRESLPPSVWPGPPGGCGAGRGSCIPEFPRSLLANVGSNNGRGAGCRSVAGASAGGWEKRETSAAGCSCRGVGEKGDIVSLLLPGGREKRETQCLPNYPFLIPLQLRANNFAAERQQLQPEKSRRPIRLPWRCERLRACWRASEVSA